jgi:hypothetical protein
MKRGAYSYPFFSCFLLVVVILSILIIHSTNALALEPPRIQCDSQQMNVNDQKVLSRPV